MKSLASWLLTYFLVIFWAFRVIVTIACQYSATEEFGGFIVFNRTFEIIMLFISLLCFILIVRRMILGGIIYLVRIWIIFWKIHIANSNTNDYIR